MIKGKSIAFSNAFVGKLFKITRNTCSDNVKIVSVREQKKLRIYVD